MPSKVRMSSINRFLMTSNEYNALYYVQEKTRRWYDSNRWLAFFCRWDINDAITFIWGKDPSWISTRIEREWRRTRYRQVTRHLRRYYYNLWNFYVWGNNLFEWTVLSTVTTVCWFECICCIVETVTILSLHFLFNVKAFLTPHFIADYTTQLYYLLLALVYYMKNQSILLISIISSFFFDNFKYFCNVFDKKLKLLMQNQNSLINLKLFFDKLLCTNTEIYLLYIYIKMSLHNLWDIWRILDFFFSTITRVNLALYLFVNYYFSIPQLFFSLIREKATYFDFYAYLNENFDNWYYTKWINIQETKNDLALNFDYSLYNDCIPESVYYRKRTNSPETLISKGQKHWKSAPAYQRQFKGLMSYSRSNIFGNDFNIFNIYFDGGHNIFFLPQISGEGKKMLAILIIPFFIFVTQFTFSIRKLIGYKTIMPNIESDTPFKIWYDFKYKQINENNYKEFDWLTPDIDNIKRYQLKEIFKNPYPWIIKDFEKSLNYIFLNNKEGWKLFVANVLFSFQDLSKEKSKKTNKHIFQKKAYNEWVLYFNENAPNLLKYELNFDFNTLLTQSKKDFKWIKSKDEIMKHLALYWIHKKLTKEFFIILRNKLSFEETFLILKPALDFKYFYLDKIYDNIYTLNALFKEYFSVFSAYSWKRSHEIYSALQVLEESYEDRTGTRRMETEFDTPAGYNKYKWGNNLLNSYFTALNNNLLEMLPKTLNLDSNEFGIYYWDIKSLVDYIDQKGQAKRLNTPQAYDENLTLEIEEDYRYNGTLFIFVVIGLFIMIRLYLRYTTKHEGGLNKLYFLQLWNQITTLLQHFKIFNIFFDNLLLRRHLGPWKPINVPGYPLNGQGVGTERIFSIYSIFARKNRIKTTSHLASREGYYDDIYLGPYNMQVAFGGTSFFWDIQLSSFFYSFFLNIWCEVVYNSFNSMLYAFIAICTFIGYMDYRNYKHFDINTKRFDLDSVKDLFKIKALYKLCQNIFKGPKTILK